MDGGWRDGLPNARRPRENQGWLRPPSTSRPSGIPCRSSVGMVLLSECLTSGLLLFLRPVLKWLGENPQRVNAGRVLVTAPTS